MPSVATALDIARLYEELRECVRANDQDGVKRVFAELVRARRPVPEILAEVKSLTKEREKSEEQEKSGPEKPAFEPREWPVQVARSDTAQNAPAHTIRDYGTAPMTPRPGAGSGMAPSAVSEEPRSPVRETPHEQAAAVLPDIAPEPAFRGPAEPPKASYGLGRSDKPATPPPSRNDGVASAAIGAPKHDARPVGNQILASPSNQSAEPARAPASPPAVEAAPAAAPSSPPVRPDAAPVDRALPPNAPTLPQAKAPQPSHQTSALQQVLARSLTAETSLDANRASLPPEVKSQAAAAIPGQSAPEAAAQVSTRAMSLGVARGASGEIEEPQPGRRTPIVPLAIVAVVIIVIAGVGWFLLSQRSGEQVAVNTTPHPEAIAPSSETKPPSSPALRPNAVAKAPDPKPTVPPTSTKPTPTNAGPRERAPADTGTPVPAANAVFPAPSPASAGSPSGAASGTPAAPQSEAPSAAAKLEPPKGTAPAASTSDGALPATPSPPANDSTAAAPAGPHISAEEAAALLSRGDALFGVGDVASARLFYERAAEAGSGEAALRLGETYDPNFLERAKLRSIPGDPKAAIHWYWRARELGVAEAEILLKGMQTK